MVEDRLEAVASGSGPPTIELQVDGMHCASCAALIQETLAADPGVREAIVDLESGRASVAVGPGKVSVDALCAAIAAAGYSATPLLPVDPSAC
jgi:Cu+-exporting ATPase